MRTSLTALVLALSLTSLTGCASGDGASDLGSADGSLSTERPRIELWQATDGWRFELSAVDGTLVLESQAYSTRLAALGGVVSVVGNGVYEGLYTITTDTNGLSHVALRAANHEVIGDCGVYATRQEANAAIAASVDAISDYQVWQETRTGRRFDVFQGVNGRWYFNLHAGNGEIVLRSQGYSSEAAALAGTFSVSDFGVSAARYDVRQATNGQWYFNLTASNGQVIGTSETYVSRYNAERARDSIIALLPTVELL